MKSCTAGRWKSKEEAYLSEDIINVSDETFEEAVIKSNLPVLVDFWAVWCAPCKMIVPTLDYLAKSYKGRMNVVKVNVDENMTIPSKYGIMSIPTLLLFKEGDVKETIVGALPQDKIVDILSKHL